MGISAAIDLIASAGADVAATDVIGSAVADAVAGTATDAAVGAGLGDAALGAAGAVGDIGADATYAGADWGAMAGATPLTEVMGAPAAGSTFSNYGAGLDTGMAAPAASTDAFNAATGTGIGLNGNTLMAGAQAASGLVGAAAAKGAANTQASAQLQAAQTQKSMFDTINKQEQPFIQAGTTALGPLMYGINGTGNGAGTGLTAGQFTHLFNKDDFFNNLDPSYQWRLQQGAQAFSNQMTPGFGALSGAAMKGLIDYNQNAASQEYGNAFNRYTSQNNSIYDRLANIAGIGQNAASQVGNNGATLGTGIAQAQSAAGGSQAAGTVGEANALAKGLTGGVANLAAMYGYQMPQSTSQVNNSTTTGGS